MEHVIVERVFADAVDLESFAKRAEETRACFSMRRVQPLRTSVSLDGRRMICEYLAPDAESVRAANQSAGFPFERAWSARVIEVEPA